MNRRVVCAALRAGDGDVLVGIRHYSPAIYFLSTVYGRLKEEASEDTYTLSHINSEGRWVGHLKSAPGLIGSPVKFATKEEKQVQEAVEVLMKYCGKFDD